MIRHVENCQPWLLTWALVFRGSLGCLQGCGGLINCSCDWSHSIIFVVLLTCSLWCLCSDSLMAELLQGSHWPWVHCVAQTIWLPCLSCLSAGSTRVCHWPQPQGFLLFSLSHGAGWLSVTMGTKPRWGRGNTPEQTLHLQGGSWQLKPVQGRPGLHSYIVRRSKTQTQTKLIVMILPTVVVFLEGLIENFVGALLTVQQCLGEGVVKTQMKANQRLSG